MPRTRDRGTFDPALRERTALVWADIIERVEVAADIENGNLAVADRDGCGGTLRDVGGLGDGNEFDGHGSHRLCEGKTDALLRDYRDWLKSELLVLGNASHHAYSLGQANMAKRAIDELDKELAEKVYVAVDHGEARRALTELDLLAQRGTALPPGLVALSEALKAALVEAQPPADEGV